LIQRFSDLRQAKNLEETHQDKQHQNDGDNAPDPLLEFQSFRSYWFAKPFSQPFAETCAVDRSTRGPPNQCGKYPSNDKYN
jgi:hypothetical protein